MERLLKEDELPDWFDYPHELLRIVNQEIIDLDPWIILQGDQLRTRFDGIKNRYPSRALVPFARREDNDDVACWDKDYPGKVVIIHDFASSGYEQKEEFENFWDWFRSAIEVMIEYEP